MAVGLLATLAVIPRLGAEWSQVLGWIVYRAGGGGITGTVA